MISLPWSLISRNRRNELDITKHKCAHGRPRFCWQRATLIEAEYTRTPFSAGTGSSTDGGSEWFPLFHAR